MALPSDQAFAASPSSPSVSPVPASIPSAPCTNCGGISIVCEEHADHPWDGSCCGGAGMPCGACDLQMASAGYVDRREKAIVTWLREIPREYSGWNDHDEIFDRGWNSAVEWIATQINAGNHWGAASAIEARRVATLGAVHESAAPSGDTPDV